MATVFLSPTGSDSYTYAQAQNSATPWLTIGKVNASAVDGDTVNLAAGTYTMVRVVFTKSFTFIGASLANGTPTTILDGADSTFSYQAIYDYNTQLTTNWNNIRFTNATLNESGVFGHYSGGGGTYNVTRCQFDNFKFTGIYGAIFASINGGHAFNITNCLVYGVTSNKAGNQNGIFMFWTAPTGTVASTITGTTVHIPVGTYSFPLFSELSNRPATIKNCIFKTETSVAFGSISTGTYSYSCAHNFTGVPAGINNITTDPLFVDLTNSNFALRPTSPCIDNGVLI